MPEARVTSEKEMEEDVGRRAAEPALRALLDCGRDAAAVMETAAPTRKALAPRAKKNLDCPITGPGRWPSRQFVAEPVLIVRSDATRPAPDRAAPFSPVRVRVGNAGLGQWA